MTLVLIIRDHKNAAFIEQCTNEEVLTAKNTTDPYCSPVNVMLRALGF